MNLDELEKEHEAICATALNIALERKGDYASPDDVFMTFRRCETDMHIPLQNGLLSRLSEKYARVCTLVRNGTWASAQFEDAVHDMINQLIFVEIFRRSMSPIGATPQPMHTSPTTPQAAGPIGPGTY